MQSGQISFQAASEGLQSNSAAQVVDGKYNIPAEKGLLPGEYVVVFQCEEKTGETETINQGGGKTYEVEITRSFVPADWGFESTHKVTVKPGKNVFDFDVPRSDAPVAPPTLSGPSGA